jgi:membrane protein implicated in regulation of membrane protease activity
MALIWLTLGVVLLLAELRHYAFFAVFGAMGAFAAALVAIVWPDQVALQLAAGVVVGGLGIWLLRPRVSSAFHQGGDGRLGRGVHGTLIGEEVTTLDVVGPDHKGHVRLAGETWLARSGSDDSIPPRTDVLVTAVDGTTLIVWPVGGHVVPPLPLLPQEDETTPDTAPDPSEGETS